MGSQLTTNGDALRLFFTDDVYLIKGDEVILGNEEYGVDSQIVSEDVAPAPQTTQATSQTDTPVTKSPEIPVLTPLPGNIPTPEKTVFKFLGNNKRNILILVNDPENDVSDEKGRELLRKIVKSINLSAVDFALLNYARYPGTSYQQLQEFFSSTLTFSFGVSPAQLGMKAQQENSIVVEAGVKMIFSSELRQLDADNTAKKVLWGSLKQLGL